MSLLWGAFGEDWEVQHKVTFDGINRLIIVGDNITEIDIKTDIYSAWKEWALIRDHTKYLPALRGIGGDPAPLGSGRFAGDIYFLINGWQIEVNRPDVTGTGIIFHDDGIPVFSNLAIPLLVSNLAFSVAPSQEVIESAVQPVLDAIDAQDVVLSVLEADLQLVRAVTAGRAIITPDDLTITVYDRDGTTILATYAISADGRTKTRTS